MQSLTQELVNFVIKTKFKDLTEAVVHESKRVLLDSIGCALGGFATDKGRISLKLARRLGGPAQSTIIGSGDRIQCTTAAFANGELINALDYDAVLFAPGHVSPFVIPASLALAEYVGASGRDLILATALGHEVATRVASGLTGMREFVREGINKGEVVWPSVHGYSSCIFGGAAGAGKILKLDAERMYWALGIAGHICPVPATMKWMNSVPSGMTKYLSAGWISQAEVTSALLAQDGYAGDKTVLDGEYGFHRYFASSKWRPEISIKRLGEEWRFLRISYKNYPCCGIMHVALDCFLKIMDENNLTPEDIERIEILLDPLSDKPLWRNREIRTQIDAQFSVAYVFAVAAHRIKVADWQDLETIKNPNIAQFMKKVSFDPHPEYGKCVLEDPTCNLAQVEVMAKGKVFKEEKTYFNGASLPEEARLNDEELEEKFRNNASRFLTWHKIDKTVSCIWDLERLEDISDLMEMVTIA